MSDTNSNVINKPMKAAKSAATPSASETIKEDIRAIRDDSAKLVQDIREGSASLARESLDSIKNKSLDELHRFEDYLRAKPLKSVGIAFLGGIALSYLLSRRR
jgi:ElaB/YqjD/DUF883 family membrane-anchored ribosome-binding protein